MTLFTFEAISRLLSELDKAYGLFPLAQWRGQSGIILRHDVDLDVLPAFRLSQLEAEVGVRGTYFFLVTAETYNCRSAGNSVMIRKMAEQGFEVGLHFDPAIYGDVEESALENAARGEAAVLEDIIGQRVASVSLHNPAVANRYPLLAGWRNAYDPDIFGPDIYLSDSRMNYRADPRVFFANAGARTHQLLLHPMHYDVEEPRYPKAKLTYIRRMVENLHATFSPNTTYQKEVGDKLIQLLRADIAGWEQ